MRIVGGKYKGRQIHTLKNLKARPTTDFAKENLFNFLSNYFEFSETKALDLFSGTGSISLELVSRGCTEVDLVEIDSQSASFIKKVVHEIGADEINVIRADAFQFVTRTKNKYDLIFADPPYQSENIPSIPDLIFSHKILNTKGWLILEHSSKFDFSDYPKFREKRMYGSVNFSVFAEI